MDRRGSGWAQGVRGWTCRSLRAANSEQVVKGPILSMAFVCVFRQVACSFCWEWSREVNKAR